MIGEETFFYTKNESYEVFDVQDVKELIAAWMRMNSSIFGKEVAGKNISFVSIDPRKDVYGCDGLYEPLKEEDFPRLYAVANSAGMENVRLPMDFIRTAVAEAKTVIADIITENKSADTKPRIVKDSDVSVDMSADRFPWEPYSENEPRTILKLSGVYIWRPRNAPTP